MPWHREQITDGEIDALYQAAMRSWDDSTRYPIAHVTTPDSGQCYVTALWLKERLGGHIGKYRGHYAWLSPEEDYILDLASHTGTVRYEENENFKSYKATPNQRTEKFARRANQIFDHLGKILHLSLDYMGDPLPASEPQRSTEIAQENDQQGGDQVAQYWHDEPAWEPSQGEYKFVYANGQLEISPFHDHEQLLAHTGVSKDHTGPIAMGHATLNNNKATWQVESNMNVKGLDRIFKEYTKKVGWDWGGITNIEGEPISDDFAPQKTSKLYWIYDEHLWIGRDTPSGLAIKSGSYGKSAVSGTLTIEGRRATVSPVVERSVASLYEWSVDSGFTLYAGNDNQLKVIPDLQEDNLYDPEFKNPDDRQYFPGAPDEREPSGLYRCPVCDRLFPGWDEYSDHRKREAEDAGEINEGPSGFPEVEESAIQDTHFTPQQPDGNWPIASVRTGKLDWDTETELYKDWPEDPSELAGVNHEENGYRPLGDEFWGAGGCAHLALAFKNVYPQMKIATGWYNDHGQKSLGHTMAYDPETGRGFDSYGVHTDPQFSLGVNNDSVDMDSDPYEIAQHMGIPWDENERSWESPEVHEGGEFIEDHFLPGEWKQRE